MQTARKESSATSKLRVVLDASAKTASGESLKDQFFDGPRVHTSLIDVLIEFRHHKNVLTTDFNKMHRGIILSKNQQDLHRFVLRDDLTNHRATTE